MFSLKKKNNIEAKITETVQRKVALLRATYAHVQ